MVNIIQVFSSWGSIYADRITGKVIDRSLDDFDENGRNYLADIDRIDISEHEHFWDKKISDTVDILDLGYWNMDGSYDGPETSWRNEARELMEQDARS